MERSVGDSQLIFNDPAPPFLLTPVFDSGLRQSLVGVNSPCLRFRETEDLIFSIRESSSNLEYGVAVSSQRPEFLAFRANIGDPFTVALRSLPEIDESGSRPRAPRRISFFLSQILSGSFPGLVILCSAILDKGLDQRVALDCGVLPLSLSDM